MPLNLSKMRNLLERRYNAFFFVSLCSLILTGFRKTLYPNETPTYPSLKQTIVIGKGHNINPYITCKNDLCQVWLKLVSWFWRKKVRMLTGTSQ